MRRAVLLRVISQPRGLTVQGQDTFLPFSPRVENILCFLFAHLQWIFTCALESTASAVLSLESYSSYSTGEKDLDRATWLTCFQWDLVPIFLMITMWKSVKKKLRGGPNSHVSVEPRSSAHSVSLTLGLLYPAEDASLPTVCWRTLPSCSAPDE